MSVSSPSKEKSQSMDPSPLSQKTDADAASDTSSVVSANGVSETGEPSDRINQPDSSFNQRKDLDLQSQAVIRSEECRQLFHLPPEEVLVQDFNCALQENILLQGHMYLFVHHICFYSNIFGFETRKIIPLHEITCVRKAKTVAIFHNAIEIVAGEKKHFFTSFLSRDEAYRLIVDGWSQHNSNARALAEQQESKSDSGGQDNMLILFERLKNFTRQPNDMCSEERGNDAYLLEDSKPLSNCEDDGSVQIRPSEVQENGEEIVNGPANGEPLTWQLEDVDCPKVPEYYTMVAESKFPIRVEEFFSLFFSDNAVGFVETFHGRCRDKDFQCTPWDKHSQFGHVRDVSFQHPIKLYFGARFGYCREVQKFRVYRNSHLVIETSQQINDVPYGDYFLVEGLWDVEQEGDEENAWCILRVYVNVSFSRKTMWKGKIEQSTVEECREAYAIWIKSAHELLKQKQNPVELEAGVASDTANPVQCNDIEVKNSTELKQASERKRTRRRISERESNSKDVITEYDNPVKGELSHGTSVVFLLREAWAMICMYLKSRSHLPLILVITFISILILTQLSIVVLLTRTPRVHLVSQENFMHGVSSDRTEAIAWLEERVYHLKEEMFMVETRLERMRHEYLWLKTHLQGLEQLKPKS
ncbi:protein VASCULAR ASSOCIATED DEATH 1, chloroplastic isoform X2 [Cinnamomum micranthum f. kanehirae]|uniref:Protein VASCULAR ASSOCIATED DEATH 1, chloroplastic isoform X2 n=1 Tax=Cinnamomum micranthum f. kanehirae TaxID=337451 RepID=A0A3S3QNZ4_9MAGN|nr:protein VASCULAR ASSOCIATED DEATH 1, chloroplastic isoform X2 [Cinnamomum micranthum f. kanehirae]